MYDQVDQLGVNTLRTLSSTQSKELTQVIQVYPMGAAPMAYVLWTRL